MPKVIYTTGITGFIGRNLLIKLVLSYDFVINFGRDNEMSIHNGSDVKHLDFSLDFIVDIKSHKINSVGRYELTKGDMIFIPNNYAHGFISKSKNVVLQYVMDDIYSPDHYDGINAINFLDKNFDIESIIISDKDKNYLKSLE